MRKLKIQIHVTADIPSESASRAPPAKSTFAAANQESTGTTGRAYMRDSEKRTSSSALTVRAAMSYLESLALAEDLAAHSSAHLHGQQMR